MKKLIAIFAFLISLPALAGPTISSVLVTATTANTATIQWNTSTPSTTMVMYGTDPSIPYSTNPVTAPVTSHTVVLQLLTPGPLYYVAAVSRDSTGNTQAAPITFSLCGGPTVPVSGTVNNYYQYGTFSLTWVPPAGASQSPTVCGQSFAQTVNGSLDGGSSFNVQVSDASKIVPGPGTWNVTVSDAGNIAPVTIQAYISAVTQNVSQQLQQAAATSGLQFCLTNTTNNASWPSSCGGGATNAVTSINGVPGAFTFGTGAICTGTNCIFPGGGVTSINALTGAVTLAAGSNITISQVGNTITITSSGGGGGGGPLGTLVNDLVTNNSSNTAAQDINNFQATPSYSAQSAITQAVAHNGVVTLLPGSGGGFTNTNNTVGVKVQDLSNLGAMPRSITEQGAYCDARLTGVSFTAGSKTATIYNDFFYTADVGKILTTVGVSGGVPTAFETAIQSVPTNGSSTATMTTAAPYALTGSNPATLAHDDTAAFNSAQAAAVKAQQSGAGEFTALLIPGGGCFVHTIQYQGVSIEGLNGGISGLLGGPGEDVIALNDPSQTTPSPGFGVHLHDFNIAVDQRIDATKAWKLVNDVGSTTKSALYRPAGILTVWANNPVAPGWFQGPNANFGGAFAGVANITAGSALMCVPSSGPAIGEKVVFPYLSPAFSTTVLSGAGSCGSGNPVTLAAALPAGSTNTQAEYWAGTSPQTLAAPISSGSCPATITLTNPITPAPGYESNVAKSGLVKIDNEQLSYYGGTNAGNLGSQYLAVTGCAQNGTVRAAHSAGALVVPLNPYSPTTPWPVTPTVNSNATTPANAAYYPAWNLGNEALAAPDVNGNAGTTSEAFSNSTINSIQINSYPTSAPINNTGGFYFVQLPYATHFADLTFSGMTYGIFEATPSFNTGGNWYTAQPTADGTSWQNIRISGCNIFDFISGGAQSFRDFNTYSNCNNGSAYTGSGAGFAFTSGWNDQGGFAQSTETNVDALNMYLEPENGSLYGEIPVNELDINRGTWVNMHLGGGGETAVGGIQQTFIGGNFNQQAVFPLINYGSGNSSDNTSLLFFGNGVGNVYGTNSLINYGPNSGFSGAMSAAQPYTAPFGANQKGNSREPWHGQEQTNWILGLPLSGNPVVNVNGGYIPASEINTSRSFEPNPFTVPWYYDSTSPSGGSVGCFLDTGGVNACLTYAFNEAGILVGQDQRIVPGKYTFWIASKSTGVASSYTIKMGVCSLGDTASFSVPVTSSYTVFQTQIDMTGKNCNGDVALDFIYAIPSNDTISVAYMDFAPVGYQPTDYNLNVLNQIILNGNPGTPGYCLVSGSPDNWAPCGSTNVQVNGTPLISTATINFVAGSGVTLTNPSAGQITISSSGGGGGGSFAALTSGTNTTMAALVGTGASLGPTGTGTITATSVPFSGITAGTNTGNLVIGSGGSISVSGSGTNTATAVPFSGVAAGTNSNALLIGGTLAATGGGSIAATTAAGAAGTPQNCSAGSAPTGVSATAFNALNCTAYLQGSLTINFFPVATGASTVGNSFLSVTAGGALDWTGAGGIIATGQTTPSAFSLSAGVGNLPNGIPPNSGGFVAPPGAFTSYVIQLPPGMSAGAAIYSAPTTLYGVPVSVMGIEHVPHELTSGWTLNGEIGANVVMVGTLSTNAGRFTNIEISYGGSGTSCTTGPGFTVFAGTNVGTTATGSTVYQGPNGANDTPQTLTFGPGVQIGLKTIGGVGNCPGYYSVTATYIDP